MMEIADFHENTLKSESLHYTSAQELKRGKHDFLMTIYAAPPVQDASPWARAHSNTLWNS